MVDFFKENWFSLAVFLLFIALAAGGPEPTRGAAVYVVVCLLFGYAVNRKTASSQGPRKWRTVGRLVKVLGPAIGVAFIAQMWWSWPSNFTLAMTVFAGLAALMFHHWGDQLSLPDAFEVMKQDPRPPLLFLRSFKEEARKVHDAPVGEREGGVRADSHSWTAGRERELAAALNRVGPFVAIGRPGEPLATLGASRVYLGDKDWRRFVESMVPLSAAIVLQPEFTPGTLWEVGFVVKSVDLRRLLLVVPDPSLRPFRFERVRKLIEETFGVALPPADQCPPCEAFYFDLHRKPVPIRLRPPEAMDSFVEHVHGLPPPGRSI